MIGLRRRGEQGPAGPWAHRLAVLTAAATLVLVFVGGVVTNTGSALAVPDWPTTFGHNMFLYPWSGMVGGILYEHSHRLMGALVGLLTLATAAALWRAAPRGGLRWLGLAAVVAVIAQGVLGGLRVVLLRQTLGIVHGIIAPTFFALTVSLALLTSPGCGEPRPRTAAPDPGPLRRLAACTTGLVYLQLAFGAVLTHTGLRLDAHLLLAGLVAIHVFWLAARALGRHGDQVGIARPVHWLAGLLILQLFLGAGSYLAKFTALGSAMAPPLGLAFPIVHRVVGALLLGTSLVVTLRAYRLAGSPEPAAAGPLSRQVPA